MRRAVYIGSLLAAGALLDELAFFILSRQPLRLGAKIRDAARF